MKKILLSVGTLAVVGAIVVGATGSFYGDTEKSTGNTFTAGSIELKVDSTSHYNGMICTKNGGDTYQWMPENGTQPPYYPEYGSPCDGTWSETDLKEGIQKFFNFSDLKPGDEGEDTISLHVYDNDAWGQFVITSTRDADNTCTGPETDAEATSTGTGTVCSAPDGNGEIDNNLVFLGWLDQGLIPGFQNIGPNGRPVEGNVPDPTEGNNIPDYGEPVFWEWETIGNLEHNIGEALSGAYLLYCENNDSVSADGHNNYGLCHGLAQDGRMVGSTTYYFGLAWEFPLETGNEAQTDEYTADLTFQVEQHRNNPNPFDL